MYFDEIVDAVVKKFYWVLGFFPQKLPITGLEELNAFNSRLFDLYGLPDEKGYQQAIATMIMHLGPTVTRKSPYWFACSIRKAMANEVAFQKLQDIKREHEEQKAKEIKAEEVLNGTKKPKLVEQKQPEQLNS